MRPLSRQLNTIALFFLRLFLLALRPWRLALFGLGGAALCVGLGDGNTAARAAAVLFLALALWGLWWQWRWQRTPRSPPIVSARTVAALDGDDEVEWKFDEPSTIFLHSRRPGEALWIEGIRLPAANRSGRPLNNLVASVKCRPRGERFRLTLAVCNRELAPDEPQTVPPLSEFSLTCLFPARDGQTRPGMSVDHFLREVDSLLFVFRYDTGQMFARPVSDDDIKRQIARLEPLQRGTPPHSAST